MKMKERKIKECGCQQHSNNTSSWRIKHEEEFDGEGRDREKERMRM